MNLKYSILKYLTHNINGAETYLLAVQWDDHFLANPRKFSRHCKWSQTRKQIRERSLQTRSKHWHGADEFRNLHIRRRMDKIPKWDAIVIAHLFLWYDLVDKGVLPSIAEREDPMHSNRSWVHVNDENDLTFGFVQTRVNLVFRELELFNRSSFKISTKFVWIRLLLKGVLKNFTGSIHLKVDFPWRGHLFDFF